MNNPSGKKLEKLVFGMFDQMVEGADKYVTKEGSTWMIFTEEKRWVVEFTKDKILWFNYNLFQSELELIGKDCTQERDLIKNWFESRFLGIDVVEESLSTAGKPLKVEDTIQNGVRHTYKQGKKIQRRVEDTIQNGVKRVLNPIRPMEFFVKDIIQNGIKCVNDTDNLDPKINECMKDSVKDTSPLRGRFSYTIQDAIQNDVKCSPEPNQNLIQEVIKNDVQDIKHSYDFEKIVVDDVISDSI